MMNDSVAIWTGKLLYMPTLEIWSPFATATLREFRADVRWRLRSSTISESMTLWVDLESSNARKSWPLIENEPALFGLW
jgi:hypothetical protein